MTEREGYNPNEQSDENKWEVKETRTFTEGEIRAEICTMDQVENSDLNVLEIIKNKEGVIVSMNIELESEKAQEKFGDRVIYNYTIKGRHSQNIQSSTTNIDRTFFDEAGDPISGGIIAEFLDGEWKPQ